MSASDRAKPSPEAMPAASAAVPEAPVDRERSRGEPLSFATLLAVAPGAGFVLAWVHEYGYIQAFGVPLNLIAPQLSHVLLAVFLLVAVGGGLFASVDWYVARRRPSSPVSTIEWQVLGFLIGAVVVAALELVPEPLFARIAFAGLLVAFGLRIFALPVITYTGTYQQRMEAAARAATVRRDSPCQSP